MTRRLATVLATVLATIMLLLLTAAPAQAHVLLAKAQPNGDGTTTLTFTYDHGCDEAATTYLSVRLPEGVTGTATTQPPGWSAQVTADTVTWTGPGVASGTAAEYTVVSRIAGRVGQRLHFPTVQRCANGGGYEWTGTAPDAERPAPALIVTTAVLASPPAAAPPGAPPAGAADAGQGASLGGVLAALAGFVLLAAGAGYLLATRTGRQPATVAPAHGEGADA
jgi:uncharacterized protein YcnI